MDIIMPQLGESVDEGTVASWHKKPGDSVGYDDILLEVETDKAAMEVPALTTGILREILVKEGDSAKVGATIAVIEVEGEDTASKTEAQSDSGDADAAGDAPATSSAPAAAAGPASDTTRKPARTAPDGTPLSPAVRRLIAQHDLDPAQLSGTGRDGRITKRDVLAYLDSGPAAAAPAPAAARAPLAAGDAETREDFSNMRRRIAQNMRASKQQSAHVLQAVEVDFSAVEAVRSYFKASWKERHGGSLTYLPFIARAVCLALPEFPRLNARQDADGLVISNAIHLGIAVNLDMQGLVVPVLKNAEGLTVPALARAAADAAERARANRLTPEDMSGGTYTLSNNGSYGTLITAPIISQPQVAILSMDGVSRRPWVVTDDEGAESLGIRPVGVLAQSFDHCVVDGAYSGAYLKRLKAILETHDWRAEFL